MHCGKSYGPIVPELESFVPDVYHPKSFIGQYLADPLEVIILGYDYTEIFWRVAEGVETDPDPLDKEFQHTFHFVGCE
jgi:hypothetical protein